MLLDTSCFPLVFLREHAEAAAPIDEQFERLLDRQLPFVLITDHSLDHHGEETPEERRNRALFFKKVKDRMRRYCRGMIVIEGGKPTGAAVRLAAAAVSKALGFAVHFEADAPHAAVKGLTLLDKDAA
ncbi:MAG: hypothetical protein J0H01_36070 [Rhizobiales bacterium]|nr:hypothetical protein [Hyphomicrobiales bacterium]